MKREIIMTEDGSPTIRVAELNETYHSTRGAMEEAAWVYINAGLRYVAASLARSPESGRVPGVDSRPEIRLLEVGFGTGLNALLSRLCPESMQFRLYYEALEKYPLSTEEVCKLHYGHFDEELSSLHHCSWERPVTLPQAPHFSLCKRQCDLLEYTPQGLFHLVYFDAFAPSVQPELWTEAVFRKIYAAMEPGGVLVTYASAGVVKTALRAAGFSLNRLPGANGKHHMLRAIKPSSCI